MKTFYGPSTAPLLSLLLALISLVSARAQYTFVTNNGAITITSYSGFGPVMNVPATTNGYPVTSISNNAITLPETKFILGTVTIPDSITNIGNNVISGCGNLTNLTLGNGLLSLGTTVFA